jgi:hypothetical protein
MIKGIGQLIVAIVAAALVLIAFPFGLVCGIVAVGFRAGLEKAENYSNDCGARHREKILRRRARQTNDRNR